MMRLVALEGYGVLTLAVALLAAFLLRLANPPLDVVRAATAPRAITVLPEISIPSAR
jgi:hypothetical protein